MSKDPVLWEVERAAALQNQGKTAEAIKAARHVLDHHGQHPAAVQAAAIWARAESHNPAAVYFLGASYMYQGKFNEARKGFELAARMKPDMAEAWSGLALCLNNQGELAAALECAEKAAAINPRDINAHLCILDTYFDTGEFEKGLAYGLKVEKTQPRSAGLCMNIGRLYKELGQIDEAKIYFKKALKIEPDNPAYHAALLILAIDGRDHDTVQKELPAVIDLFDKMPHQKNMIPVVWSTIRSMQVLVDRKPPTETGLVRQLRSLNDPDTHSQNLLPVDFSGPVKLFETRDLNCFTSDLVYYDAENIWMNHRFTGTPFRFLMNCDMNGLAYVEERFPRITLEETGIFLDSVDNYYHWLIDYLPRLGILDTHPELRDLPIYVGDNITANQVESLGLLGISSEKLRRVPKHTLALLKHVYIPHLPGRPMRPDGDVIRMKPNENPYILEWLNAKFRPSKPVDGPRKRYFLTRAAARFRRCQNEEAIFAIAQQYGFEKINNDGKSFQEQVDTYAGAEALLGPHGAAFTNMAFMPHDAKIFELFPMHRKPPFYEAIARQKGQTYLSLDGPILRSFEGMTPDFGDFTIDVERFSKIMEENFG